MTMTPSRSLARASSCALLTLAAPAAAAPPSPVAPVSERAIDATPSTLVFDVKGNALTSWQGLRGRNPNQASSYHALAGGPGGSGWRLGPVLPATVVDHEIAVNGGLGAALVTWRQEPVSRNRSRSSIVLTLGDIASLHFSDPRRLDSGPARKVTFEGPQPTVLLPAVATTPARDVFVAWQRSYPADRAGVYFGGRRFGKPFMKPRLIGPRGGEPFLVASPDGTALLAWRRGRRILASVRYASGRWGAQETVLTARSGAAIERVAFTAASGQRFAAGIVQTHRSMAGVRARLTVTARLSGAGWRRGQLADYVFVPAAATAFVTDGLRVIPFYTSEGRLRAAWPNLVAGVVRVVVSELIPEPGGIGTRPALEASLPGANAALEDVAVGPDGRYALTWFDLSDGVGTPGLAEGDAAGHWQTTARLATERALRGAQVAYDPVSGRPTVVWSEGGSPGGYRLVAWTAL